jgi:hypothetical protein
MMSWTEWANQAAADREARTRRERHGAGELTLLDDIPIRATGCLLLDGSLTDAERLLSHIEVDDALQVWTRRLPGTAIRRRGRLIIEPGIGLRFMDERDADFGDTSGRATPTPSLERDLGFSPRIRELVRSDIFATLLYAAMCNTVWRHGATGTLWHCSWRHASAVVAMLRGEGDSMDWYCSMSEGLVDEQVMAELADLGWDLAEAEPREE